jgi:hypothetical protein
MFLSSVSMIGKILFGKIGTCQTFDEGKFVHVVEGLPEGSMVGDEIALGEQGFEFRERYGNRLA